MIRTIFQLLTAILFLGASKSFALYCANDVSGDKKSSNYAINSTFNALLSRASENDPESDPLVLAYKKYLEDKETGACEIPKKSASGFASMFTIGVADIKKLTVNCNSQDRPMRIKRDCVKAALNRDSGGEGFNCKDGKLVPFANRSATSACLNEKIIDYITWSTNQAIDCLSPALGAPSNSPLKYPVDPRVVLKKFNSESGFNFFLAKKTGKGISQLINDPALDMAGWYAPNSKTRKIEWNEGNGKPILRAVAESKNPACAPFAKIIQDELDGEPPPLPGTQKNYCSWISAGEGLGRNLIYGIGYFILARDRYIRPTLNRLAPKLANNMDVLNYFTLVAYGPKGQNEANALIDDLNPSNSTNPAELMKKIRANSDYVDQYENKMIEVQNLLGKKDAQIKPDDQTGDTCLEK